MNAVVALKEQEIFLLRLIIPFIGKGIVTEDTITSVSCWEDKNCMGRG